MTWKGKAIGAGLGSILGPIRTVVGGFVGHLYDEHCDAEQAFEEEAVQRHMAASAVLSLHASAARVNGSSIKKANLISSLGAQVRTSFQVADDPSLPICDSMSPEECAQTLRSFSQDVQVCILRDLFSICSADGLDDNECRWLDEVGQRAGLPPEAAAVWCFFKRPDRGRGKAEALNVLGLSGNPGEEEIKSAYRSKCMDYHPDRLGAVVPDHIRKLAEEKMREITAAHEGLTSKATNNGLALMVASGALVSAHEVTIAQTVQCALCGQANRIKPEKLNLSRCGSCFALLALPEEFLGGMNLYAPQPAPAQQKRRPAKRRTGAKAVRTTRKRSRSLVTRRAERKARK